MKGFIVIGLSTYQMMEIEPSEMDALIKKGDSMLWPFRFDRNKRIFPVPPDDCEPIYYESPFRG
jgi:hypothetical protein